MVRDSVNEEHAVTDGRTIIKWVYTQPNVPANPKTGSVSQSVLFSNFSLTVVDMRNLPIERKKTTENSMCMY